MENQTAKHFVLQLGSLVSLYLSLSFLLVLVFGIINLAFPDPGEGYYATADAMSRVRLGIAMVVVFFPTYLILTRTVNQIRRSEPTNTYLALTRWLIYLSLLVGGTVLLGDLVAVVMFFLEGEITIRFMLKALAVLVVIGAAFYYYLLDARSHWLSHERASVYFSVAAAAIAFVAVVLGFTVIESPGAQQARNVDERQISDLQTIQSQIESFYTINNTLPETLTDLPNQSLLPQAPDGRSPYDYQRTENGFRLCATFSYPSDTFALERAAHIKNPWDWNHTEGTYCFARVVGPPATTSTTAPLPISPPVLPR